MSDMRRFAGAPGLLVFLVAVLALGIGSRFVSSAPGDHARVTFSVEIEGRALGRFHQVSGLGAEVEVVEFRDGSGGPVRYLPGEKTFSRVTLSRAYTGDTGLYDWFTQFAEGSAPRVQGTIVLSDPGGTELTRWTFHQGWPSKYSGPTLDGNGNEVPIESIELVHEGLSLDRP